MSGLPDLPNAAALSQTAGVPDITVEMWEAGRAAYADWIFRTYRQGMPTEEDRDESARIAIAAMLAAAPAASGGDADTPRETLLDQSLRERTHKLVSDACSAWSDVKDGGELNVAKCEYAGAQTKRLRAYIDQLADMTKFLKPPAGASVSERARDERFTAMLIGIIADVQDALGFTDEDKECSNGSLEIVAAIRELKEQALTQQRGESEAFHAACDMFQIGSDARNTNVLLGNLSNVKRFAEYLHAIEHEFFMVPGEPDEDFPDDEPEPECLVNSWGSTQEQYVEQFRAALAKITTSQPGAEALRELQDEIDRLNAIINTPQANDFLRAVSTEAEHQRQRWGTDHDAGKEPADWFWLVGYLAGKALHAHAAGDVTKAEHHIITTAAALENWHLAAFGNTDMRPGIDGESLLARGG